MDMFLSKQRMLRKIEGAQTMRNCIVIHKKTKEPYWWKRRVERKRKSEEEENLRKEESIEEVSIEDPSNRVTQNEEEYGDNEKGLAITFETGKMPIVKVKVYAREEEAFTEGPNEKKDEKPKT